MKKKGHHVLRRPIFLPKPCEDQKIGHHVLNPWPPFCFRAPTCVPKPQGSDTTCSPLSVPVCIVTSQNFSSKNDLTFSLLGMSKKRTFGHFLASSEDNFLVKQEDMSFKRRAYGKPISMCLGEGRAQRSLALRMPQHTHALWCRWSKTFALKFTSTMDE